MASPRRLLLLPAVLLLPLAGCPDQPLSGPGITIHGDGAALVAIKDGEDAWRTVGLSADGAALVPVTGPYQIARVCSFAGDISVSAVLASLDDETEWELGCWFAHPINVTIESVGNLQLEVFIGDSQGNELLRVRPGTYDVLAIEGGEVAEPRFLILRDVEIDDATTIRIDLAADGIALQRHSVEVIGATVPFTSVSSDVELAGTERATRAWLPALPWKDQQVYLIPEASLGADDGQTVRAVALEGEAGAHQGATIDARVADDLALRVELPAPGESAMIDWSDGPSAAWRADRDWSTRSLAISGSGSSVEWGVTAHPSWLADVGDVGVETLRFPEVAAIPGWQAEWSVDLDAPRDWFLTLRGDAAATTPWLSWSQFRVE